jgi:hypothetical protein
VRILVREAAGASLNGVRSLLELSTYPNFKVALPAAIASQLGLPDERIQVYDPSLPEDDLSSDYVVCMDADLEVITPDWMQHLLHYCEQPDVACAAPLLVQPDGSVWQGGQVLGMGEGIDSPLRGWPADSDGYAGSLSCAREVTAVSGECLMISASLWRDLGRSRKYYALPLFEGADLALQAFTMKRRNILTPRARLRKPAPVVFPPGWSLDRALFRDRWEELIKMGDPYYNSNFALSAPGYSAAPGRSS